jgi:hypothetical protein
LWATIGLFNQGAKMISKSEMLSDIGIAITGTAMLIFGAGAEGFIAKCAIGWGGLFMGYLITTYMGEDNV